MIKNISNHKIILLLFIYLIFPFFLTINIKGLEISLKIIFLLIVSIFVLKDLIEKKKYTKLLNKIFVIFLIVYFISLFIFFFKSDEDNFYLNLYLSNFFNSFIIGASCIMIFIWLVENLNKDKNLFIFQIINSISILIICEFIFYYLFVNFFSNIISSLKVSNIYSIGQFRSILIGDHILTSVFMGINFFINIFFLRNKFNKKNLIICLFSALIIFYNFETRLTVLSFIFSIIMFFYSLKIQKVNFLIKYNIYFIVIIFLIIYFSKYGDNYLMIVEFFNFKIVTSSLLDRLNINLLMIYTFLQNPLGVGWNMGGNFLHLNTFTPLIYFGDLDLLSSFITYSQKHFAEFHGAFIQPHGFITNFLVSFGIFNFLIYNILSKKILNHHHLNFSNFSLILSIIILFLTTSLMINYIANIEIICAVFFGMYFNLKKNEK